MEASVKSKFNLSKHSKIFLTTFPYQIGEIFNDGTIGNFFFTHFSVKKIQLFVDIDLIILFRRSKYHRQQSNYFQKKNIFH